MPVFLLMVDGTACAGLANGADPANLRTQDREENPYYSAVNLPCLERMGFSGGLSASFVSTAKRDRRRGSAKSAKARTSGTDGRPCDVMKREGARVTFWSNLYKPKVGSAMRSNETNAPALQDMKVHVKLKLASLWTSLMFCYIYGDYFGLFKPGNLQDMLRGQMGPLGPVTQGVLVGTSALLAIPGLMIFLSLVMKPVINRAANVVLGLFYTLVMLVTMPGAW
ncbi:DUF6326 family protein [Dyella soli]|uniref:DUF6326 family protein n=1 Tax=Dyella soli TaxID=522319 RepID=UPI001F117EA7|nr:DUF6326 family protein [Dyella soli]